MTKRFSLEDLTKGNVWTITESELNQMLIDGKKHEDFAENEAHYMNIIRPVFDVQYINREDESTISALEAKHYEVFYAPNDGPNNAVAIRKRPIKKITDLTMENIFHLDTDEVLRLIENNMGTGWQGLPLAVQDIIEQAFFVDCSTLPAYAMHRAGGIIDRHKDDGYDVLEIDRGGWIEGIFIKPKPRHEKVRFDYQSSAKDEDIDDIDDDDDLPDTSDDTPNMDDDMDDEAPEDAPIDEISDDIPDETDDDDDDE